MVEHCLEQLITTCAESTGRLIKWRDVNITVSGAHENSCLLTAVNIGYTFDDFRLSVMIPFGFLLFNSFINHIKSITHHGGAS